MKHELRDYFRPLFIILNEEGLNALKIELEQVLKLNLEIKNYYQYKALYIPNSIINNALVEGLKIAEEQNLKGVWLDEDYNPRSFDCFPLKSYFLSSSYLNGYIISASTEKEYLKKVKQEEEKKKQLKKYFEDLQAYLKHNVRIDYTLEGRIELSIYCKFHEYEELKKQFLEYEKINKEDIFFTNNQENHSRRINRHKKK